MTTDMKSPTDEQVEEIWKTLKFDQCQIFRNPDEAAKHLRGELVRAALASRPDAQADERDREILEVIDERDRFERDATELAEKVGQYLGVDVGEWSSANDPIIAAMEALDERVSVQQSAQADERGAFDIALNALQRYQDEWDTGLPSEYAQSERIQMECACEAVREALQEARAAAPAPVSVPEQPPAENAAVRNKIAAALHYPDHWDDTAYPTLDHAAWEAIATSKLACSECAEQPVEANVSIYVDCYECRECGHVGINDAHPTDAACGYPCGWSGPSPVEDKCPGCGKTNVMSSACPKCSGLYRMIAEAHIDSTSEQPSERVERPIEPEDIDAVAEAIQRETSVEWLIASRAAVAAIDTLIARGNHASEHGEQDCPHGVDDGACKQCYGEATSGEQGEAKGVCQRCGGTGVVDDGEITGAGVEFENGPVKCVKDCQDCADSAPAKAEAKCKACNGNDGDMPCAYPEGRPDCLRNASATTLGDGVIPADCDVRKILLRVVPGDGDGYEVYAKNVSDVENLLCELGQRLEDLELASTPQPQAAEPPTHWRDKPQNIALLAVERGDPVDCDGTFACPICGKGEPHHHSSDEIAKFRITQRQHKVIDALLSKADALIVSYTNVSGNHHGQLDSAIEMVRNARALLSKGE